MTERRAAAPKSLCSSTVLWPACSFAVVFGLHLAWSTAFPDQGPGQAEWASYPAERSWFGSYIETQLYWLGYTYALSAAFGVYATVRFLSDRSCAARNAAVGGFTLTGGLALAGCFLVGCCGSPMLAVWLGLFGAGFLPFAKPLIAVATTAMILASWLWMWRRRKRGLSGPAAVTWQQDPPARTSTTQEPR